MNRTSFFAAWIGAFLGFPIGGLLASAIAGRMDTPLDGLIGGAIAGAVIGAVGWLALRRPLGVSAWWIAATAIGLGVGVAVSAALFGTETTVEAIVLRAPLTGAIVGLAQALVLRRTVRGAGWWVGVMTVVYPLAWWVTTGVIQASVNEGFYIFGASGALVHQALTGAALWLLARRASD